MLFWVATDGWDSGKGFSVTVIAFLAFGFWLRALRNGQSEDATVQICLEMVHINILRIHRKGSGELGFASGRLAFTTDMDYIIITMNLQVVGLDARNIDRKGNRIICLEDVMVTGLMWLMKPNLIGPHNIVQVWVVTENG